MTPSITRTCFAAALLLVAVTPAAAGEHSGALMIAADLRSGDIPRARTQAEAALLKDPRDARLQFLNGLALHLDAERGDTGSFDLARVGYETALKFAPNDFWASYMLGTLSFERGQWLEAQQHFATAALDEPDNWRGFYGLAAASYYAGDTPLARLCAERAVKLAPGESEALRIAAFTAAMDNDAAAARAMLAGYSTLGGPQTSALAARTEHLIRTAALDAAAPPAVSATPAPEPSGEKQMLVEVTILVSDNVRDTGRGVNLLDGLRLQFGIDRSTTESHLTGAADTFQRIITSRIALPELNYNLNIFNNSGESYQVLARPTLMAYLGEESTFFAGQSLNVEVSGVNLGQLQPIDAGVTLKLTPQAIAGDTVKFRLDAQRSFFSSQRFGTFDKQIATFKQQVAATAELNYGQTLILSGLSETVYDGTRSETPGLADIPGLGLLFGRQATRDKQTSVLILVTPLRPVSTVLPRRGSRPEMAARLVQLWTTLIDPQSDIIAISARLGHMRIFTRAERGDVSLQADARLVGEVLAAR